MPSRSNDIVFSDIATRRWQMIVASFEILYLAATANRLVQLVQWFIWKWHWVRGLGAKGPVRPTRRGPWWPGSPLQVRKHGDTITGPRLSSNNNIASRRRRVDRYFPVLSSSLSYILLNQSFFRIYIFFNFNVLPIIPHTRMY